MRKDLGKRRDIYYIWTIYSIKVSVYIPTHEHSYLK